MQDDHKRADVRVGIFVLSALVILVIGSLWIAGSTLLAPQRASYLVLMKDSGGVAAGDRVRMAGVPVGKVERVELRPGESWPVTFHIAVRRSVPLHTDASARITASGLLGTVFLQVDPGSSSEPELEEGGQFYGQSSAGFEAMIGHTLTMVINSDGTVESLEGSDELIDRMLEASPEAAQMPQMREIMKKQFGDEALSSMMEQSMAIYPDKPVAIGDSWSRNIDLSQTFPMSIDVTWTLKEVTDDTVLLDVDSTVSSPEDPADTSMGVIPFNVQLEGTQVGTVTLNRESGWIRKGETTQDVNGTMSPSPQAGLPPEMQGVSWPIIIKSEITIREL